MLLLFEPVKHSPWLLLSAMKSVQDKITPKIINYVYDDAAHKIL